MINRYKKVNSQDHLALGGLDLLMIHGRKMRAGADNT